MKKNYFVIVCLIIINILIIVATDLWFKLKESSNNNITFINTAHNVNMNIKKYSLGLKQIGDNTLTKPIFKNNILDQYIDEFINSNKCNKLDYKITELSINLISINLGCNKVNEYKVFDLTKSSFVDFMDLVKDKESFIKKVYNLLYLKYPKFVVEEVDIINSNFTLNEYEIILKNTTMNYGDVNLTINNNEINDYLLVRLSTIKEYVNEVYTLDPNKKTVAFTFDDGPSTYDIDIVNALVESHSSATFFLVGSRLNNYERSVKHIADNKMEIANHSQDHKRLSAITKNEVLNQVNSTNDIIKQMVDKEIKLLRPPYGAYNDSLLQTINMPIILWNVDTLDWKTRNTKKIYESIMNVKDGDIILMHSLFEPTKDAVIKAIPELYKEGYQIVSVSELAKLKGISLESGIVYRSLATQT